MQLGWKKRCYKAYGGDYYKFRRTNKQDALYRMTQYSEMVLASTSVGNILVPRWIAVADCDDNDSFVVARNWLKQHLNVGFGTICSCPGRFWIITDYVSTFSKTIKFMSNIPGNDKKFVRDGCVNAIAMRIGPKVIENKMGPSPSQFDIGTLSNPKVIKWFEEFQGLLQDPDYKLAIKRLELELARQRRDIMSLAADPDFVV